MTLSRITLYISLLLLCNVKALAQKKSFVGHIGSEDGLVSQLCQHLIEDDLGNLWITTFQDIQKYNGHSVKVFPIGKSQGDQDGIIDVYKDMSGKIWINKGSIYTKHFEKYQINFLRKFSLTVIDPISNKVTELKDLDAFNELKEENITSIKYLNNILYFVTRDNLIYRYTDKLELFCENINLDGLLIVDASENLLLCKNNEVIQYDKNGRQLAKIDSTTFTSFEAMVTSDYGQLFLLDATGEKVRIKEFKEGKIHDLKELDRKHFQHYPLELNTITSYPDGSLKLADRFFHKSDTTNLVLRSSHKENLIYEYLTGQSGLSFIATNLGVYVLENKKSLFSHIANNDIQGLNSVRGIYKDERIAAYRNSDEIEVVKSKTSSLDLSFMGTNLGTLASMHYLDPKNKNHLWSVGYIPGLIRRIDLSKNKIDGFDFDTPSPPLINNILRSSITDNIVAASLSGLYKLDSTTNQLNKMYLACLDEQDLITNQIVEMGNNLCIASSKGLIVYDELEESCVLYPVIIDSSQYEIQFIHVDQHLDNTLWLAAKRGGLIKWNTDNQTYTVINTDNGLSNNDVHAILEDNDERLWISTNRYLNCLDKKSGKLSIFTESDGITHSEFNRFSYFYDTLQNHIYLGGLNGYTYFNPDSINTDINENNIKLRLIDAFKTKENATSENIYAKTLSSNSIEFNEADISLQLNIATNHYANLSQRQFSYRIPGLIDEWKTQSTNDIKINRLPYGDYRVEMVSDLNKPTFTSDILSIDLVVSQPFRKTTTFFFLCLMGFLSLLWLAVQQYLKTIKERNRKLEETVAIRTKELTELNKTKNKLFTILAHDLRNPIGSLADITEKIKFLSRNNRLDEIDILAEQTKHKINALDESLSNVLIWALSENKMLVQRPEKLSIKLEINKILDIYSTQINEKEITTSDNLDIIDQTFLDISVLQTILRNIISNALKFSFKGGHVRFEKTSETKEIISISVIDNGIGLDNKNTLNKMETSIRTKGKGSGIGLRLVKELAAVADISISFTANPEGGCIVRMEFPKN